MKFTSIYPYYHPTTVAIVDDNRDFLINLSLLLNEDIAFKLYTSPISALQKLNNHDQITNASNQCLSLFQGNYDTDIADNIISVDVSKIKSLVNNKTRFTENAIVIVDYDMPEMNGLQLCQMLNKKIKKIMISGVADEKIAVDAFNKGIIDKFILKNDEQSTTKINNFIYEFQNKYIQDKTQTLKNTLNIKAYGFLNDPVFIDYFFDLLNRLEVVEYYLVNNPTGFLLFTRNGQAKRLLVMDDDEITSHIEVIDDNSGPYELQQILTQREAIPYFWQSDGFYTNEISDWKMCIYPTYKLTSTQNYYTSIVENVSILDINDNDSYNSYINQMDNQFIENQHQQIKKPKT